MTSDHADFLQLFRRAKDGDPEAIERLLTDHLAPLRAFVRLKSGAIVRAKESASDLVQSVCREVLHDLEELECDDEAAFRRWLFAVAHHKILHRAEYHAAQKRDAARQVPLEVDRDREVLDSYKTLCTPSRHAALREEIGRVEAAFDELPDEYRDVIIQHRLVGRSHKAIADEMGKSEEAVRKLLSRARAKLALLLEPKTRDGDE